MSVEIKEVTVTKYEASIGSRYLGLHSSKEEACAAIIRTFDLSWDKNQLTQLLQNKKAIEFIKENF